MDSRANEYHPDYVSPPGDTLGELMDDNNMTPKDLAVAMNCPLSHIHRLLVGLEPIDGELAVELERQFGVRAEFWLARERDYREWLDETESCQHWMAEMEDAQ